MFNKKSINKMKTSRFIPAVVVSAGLLFNSCIREEALNMEADIEGVTIANAESLLQTEPVVDGNNITFRMKTFSGSYNFAPIFNLSEGATISPASGTELDFTQPQTYTVTSQDGAWSRQYTVSFVTDDNAFITSYSFENIEEDVTNKYHKFYETLNNQKLFNWSSGNDGFSLTNSGGTADTYPTLQVADGYSGKGVRMITRSTGWLGSMFGAPIAAGNLFLGTFSLNIANTLKSTRFGIPYNYNKAPKAVTGYFKYKAGATFTKKDRSSTLTKDTWNAYAILFEKSKKIFYCGITTSIVIALFIIASTLPFSNVFTLSFTREKAVLDIANRALNIYTYSVIGFGIFCVCQGVFIALARTKVPMFMSILRIWFFRYLFILFTKSTLGLYSVFWGNLFSNLLAGTVFFILVLNIDWNKNYS